MAQQIKWFEKNLIDLEINNITITITDGTATSTGQSFVDFMRNRKNTSSWSTTGSNDAANTQIDVDMTDSKTLDTIILVNHNWGAYTIQYWNGSSFTDFSTAINVSGSTASTTEHTFNSVSTNQIRIIITGTQTADDDKSLAQLLFLSSIGQFSGWPQIKKPTVSRNRKTTKLLSGKSHISTSVGSFSCTLSVQNWNNANDISILETLYESNQGVLMWINAGDDTQFSRTNIGYRGQDFYLIKTKNEYMPEFYNYYYNTGIKIDVDLVEVVT